MRVIQDKQPDGTVHHMPEHDCPIAPCARVGKEGGLLDKPCGHLHSDGVDAEGNLIQVCKRPSCRSGG